MPYDDTGRFGTAIYGRSLYGVNYALAELPGPRWDLIAYLPRGSTALADLQGARDKKFTFRLTEPSTVEWQMRGADQTVSVVDELRTDVVAYRNGVRLLRARVGASSDTLGPSGSHEVKFSAADYRALLGRRTIWDTTQQVYTAEEQSDIAWSLIADTQALTGGNLGITRGLGRDTDTPRNRAYDPGKNLLEAINQLSQVQGGFDWDISPELEFDIHFPSRGVLRGFVAEYGTTVAKADRQVDPAEYANAARISGAEGTTPTTRVAADLATRREGRWEVQVGDTDVSVDSTIEEKADWLLSEKSVIRPAYKVTLAPGVWDGPATLWLGDTCRLIVKSLPRLNVDTTARVVEIAVSAGDDGGETVDITFDRPMSSFVRKASKDRMRLDRLERR